MASSSSDQQLHDELDRLAAFQPRSDTIRLLSPGNTSSATQRTADSSTSISPPQRQFSPGRSRSQHSNAPKRHVSPSRSARKQQMTNSKTKQQEQPIQTHADPAIDAEGNSNNISFRGARSRFHEKSKTQQHSSSNSNIPNGKVSSPKRKTAASSSYGEAAGVTQLGRHEVTIYADQPPSNPRITSNNSPLLADATLPSSTYPSIAAKMMVGQSGSDLDDMTAGQQGSAMGSLTLGSFSRTQVAGNLTMTPSSLLLSGIVNLSLMRTPTTLVVNDENSKNADTVLNLSGKPAIFGPITRFLYMPSPTRTVQESLDRHIQFLLTRHSVHNNHNHEGANENSNQTDSFDTIWNCTPSYSLDSSSLYEPAVRIADRVNTNSAARECLRHGDIEAAIAVYQAARQKQHQLQEQVVSFTSGSGAERLDTSERVETLSKMSILLLYAGRNQEAMETVNEASALILQDNPFAETRPLQAVMITMAVGLIHLSSSRMNKALQSWRQTIQTCFRALGYDHPIVAVLMNNIGVLHAETGDTMAASKALEESLLLQRSLLKSGHHTDTDYSLHQMATTMSNLAIILELQEEFNAALNYLQESQALYESVEGDDDGDAADSVFDLTCASGSLTSTLSVRNGNPYHNKIQRIVQYHLDRLHKARQDFLDRKVRNASSTLLETSSIEDGSSEASDDTNDPEATEDAIMAGLVEKRSLHGKHSVQKGHRKTLQLSDIYDYILLGSLRSEWTPRERIRETVLAWFGRPSAKTKSRSALPLTASLFGLPIGAKTQITSRGTITGTWDDKAGYGQKPSSLLSQAKANVGTNSLHKKEHSVEKAFAKVRAKILEHVERDDLVGAMEICQHALDQYKSAYSDDHGLVGMALHMTGMLHLLAEEYLQAYGVFKEAVKVRKTAHGVDDVRVASTLMKLALLEYAAMDIPAAGRTMGEIRDKYLKVLGFGHPHLAQIMNNIAVLRYEQGDIDTAIRALEIAYEYQRKIIEDVTRGPAEQGVELNHTQVAEVVMAYTLSNIAFLYYHKDDQLSSLRLYEEARGILSRNAPPSDRVMLQIQDSIECLMGRGVDMVPCDERCRLTGQDGALSQSAQCHPTLSQVLCRRK